MSRYIDADALIPMMKYATTDSEVGIFPIKIGLNDIVKVINDMPTADVRENVRGEWLEREVTEDVGQGIQEWQQARCSVCGKWHTTPYMYYFSDYNFCPNCGADMKGEKHADD